MTYRVKMHRRARVDLDAAADWAVRHAPHVALVWLDRFEKAIATLSKNPQRCALARENRRVPFELRERHFGRRPNVFRVLFTIQGEFVRVLRIRRAQRRPVSGKDLRESLQDE